MLFLLSKKPNASPGTTELDLSHEQSITTVQSVLKVRPLQILSYDKSKIFTCTGRLKMPKHREDLRRRPTERKETVLISSDTQPGLHEEQIKAWQFNGAQFMVYSQTDFTRCRINFKSYSSCKTMISQLARYLEAGACIISKQMIAKY